MGDALAVKTPARRVHTGDHTLDRAQRNGSDAITRLNGAVFNGGVVLPGIVFVGGTAQSLKHGLGRKANGWIEVYDPDVPSAALVGLFSTANPSPLTSDTHVTVTPTSSGTCSLFVY